MLFAGILTCAFAADAAQEPYDIDLKELRRPPLHRTNELKLPRLPGKTTATAANGKSSSYTVQPGDHLFLILMQHYGLSNNAAERLIPEIMHLNGLSKAESLSVGQKLNIPLPAAADRQLTGIRQKKGGPDKSEIASAPHTVTATPSRHEVVASLARPCRLARELAEQLGAQVAPLPPFMDAEGFSMAHNTSKVAVAWFLAPAEAYTLERLLAPQGIKLLLFKGDEAPRSVIEGIAKSLKIPFSLSDTATTAELPLTYLFPVAVTGKDLELTIRQDTPASK